MSDATAPLKRVKRKIKKCQNPLFEKWLKEWKDEAAKNGSEMQYCFNKALKSLQKFPFKLESGKECIMLENFGTKICQMLDKKLEESSLQQTTSVELEMRLKSNTPKHQAKKRKSESFSSPNVSESKRKTGEFSECLDIEKASDVNFLPAVGSGAYAILITMLLKSQEHNFKGYLLKNEIQTAGQDYCSSSFTVPKANSHYTAWSSMNTLIKKNYVVKSGNPARYTLTKLGTNTAIILKAESNVNKKVQLPDDPICIDEFSKTTSSEKHTNKKENIKKHSSTENEVDERALKIKTTGSDIQACKVKDADHEVDIEEDMFMAPGSFKIILLVDNQERDNKFQSSEQMTLRQLKIKRVDFEMRHLKVGDYIWIARNDQGQELVLPFVVERKRMDDLASSIKDGRFHEQKFRLKQSRVENLIYLVEKYGSDSQRLGLPLPTLAQAISNTQVVGRFTVKITNDHNHSMRYLDCMTTQLNNIFKNKTLMNCKKSDLTELKLSDDLIPLMTFKDFSKGSEKNKKLTVRNMLVKHLLQLNGVSVEKAKAIVQHFPTPKLLIESLRNSDGEKTISKLTCGSFNRSIGPVTAKQIHMLYTSIMLQ